MAAANLQHAAESVTPGPAPLHFYAGPDSIYIILSDASALSALGRLAGRQSTADVSEYIQSTAGFGVTDTMQSSAMDEVSKNTLDVSTFMAQRERADELRQNPFPATANNPTLKPDALKYGSENKPVKLTVQEATDQTNRIRYVAQLINRARYPLCPVNGVMVLVPFNLLTAPDDTMRNVQHAIKSDLSSLQETLTLKAPTVAMFTGLEQDDGFRELVRRVGPVGASKQRFGHGMDVRSRATADELKALAAHACGAFEDWAYTLFREDGALTRPGNTLLHSLLCTVRSQLKNPVAELLANGFGDSSGDTDAETAFAGCYFAATGSSEDQQAFVRGVFDKMIDLQEDLEWTSQASKKNRNSRAILWTGVICCATLALSLVALIVSRPN